ncbi:hypothetical protein BDN71DRAFT_1435046 [Pleurotus eryngii]|uniref:Uncharacterized protein n=1 Tax=Pleurotus eryngii TaxID=5323 RepID=A0A9P6DBQ9_PLEER|nr:hypothetical protein BDN71DRAFT_1435046 [Pleurotus eryngii]
MEQFLLANPGGKGGSPPSTTEADSQGGVTAAAFVKGRVRGTGRCHSVVWGLRGDDLKVFGSISAFLEETIVVIPVCKVVPLPSQPTSLAKWILVLVKKVEEHVNIKWPKHKFAGGFFKHKMEQGEEQVERGASNININSAEECCMNKEEATPEMSEIPN